MAGYGRSERKSSWAASLASNQEDNLSMSSRGSSKASRPSAKHARQDSGSSVKLVLDINDFKGDFQFDSFFSSLVGNCLHSGVEGEGDDVSSTSEANGAITSPQRDGQKATFAFSEAEALLPIIKDARRELLDLKVQVNDRLERLKKEVEIQEGVQQQKVKELEKGVEGLFASFGRLDTRISGVGQTAARIGDHLQSADAQREAASETIDMIRYLQEFNACRPGDFMGLNSLFQDDDRCEEAAVIAQKLRAFAEEEVPSSITGKGVPSAGTGLEAAVTNLQEYCNELENRLLARFDMAAQRQDLDTMKESAQILSQFNRGSSAMQRYVASRPMFMEVELMEADAQTALNDASGSGKGLERLYAQILATVKEEAGTIEQVFPNPEAVMALLVQRVLEQRVHTVLDRLLAPPAVSSGELALPYLRMLAAAYEKTMALAVALTAVGCGDLDVEVLADSLFSQHRDDYIEHERVSLVQLFEAKMAELDSQAIRPPGGAKGQPGVGAVQYPPMSVGVVNEFLQWNQEAVARAMLLTPEPALLATNVKHCFITLLHQVSEYTSVGLQRAQEALAEAAVLRERFVIGTSVSRRVAAAAAAAAEAAAASGESSVRAFLLAVQRATANVALLQQHFAASVARILMPVEGLTAACAEEMASSMTRAEFAALQGLRSCLDTIMAETERLLSAEQKVADFRPPEDGSPPDHRPTSACTRVVQYLGRIMQSVNTALEGLNKQSFLAELGARLHKALLLHMSRFTFNPSGGLRLKRDVSEYTDFVRIFKAHSVDEKFESLGTLVNVFIVAPESLPTMLDGSTLSQKEAFKYIQLRTDFKTANIASMFSGL